MNDVGHATAGAFVNAPTDDSATTEVTPDTDASVPGESELNRLLDDLLERPEDWDRIIEQIDRTFTQTKAIMVLDMSGFSRTTQDRGIAPFLLMIHQMRLLSRPSVAGHSGKLIKSEADNLYCIFDSVDEALAASREIAMRLQTANVILPRDRKLYASIGIGYGEVLNVGDQDLWGNEMNLACKLGEDIAELGNILLSEAAVSALSGSADQLEKRSVSISGLELTYYQVP